MTYLKSTLLPKVLIILLACASVSPPGLGATANLPQAVTASSSSVEDPLSGLLKNLKWEPIPAEGKQISFEEVVRQTVKNDLEVQLSQEKINETEVKQKDIEGKRLLFFFKYFNSEYLEGSAESDVMTASAHANSVLNQELLESAQKYFGLMQALMAKYVAYQAIIQGEKQLEVNQSRFQSGESTSFEVMQTKTQLVKLYQDYLQSDLHYQTASLLLSEQLNLESQHLLYPADLQFQDGGFQIKNLQLFPVQLTVEESLKLGVANRSEVKELKFRKISMANMIKALPFDRVQGKILQSTIRQIELRQAKLEQAIMASATKGFSDYRLCSEKIQLSNQQLHLALKTLQQAQISHKSGFLSNKDVLDAQVAYAQAQVGYANALVNYNLSQIQLLYEMGLISADALVEGKIEL